MISPQEALAIFDQLRVRQSTVFCTGRLFGWTMALRGRVVSSVRDEVVIVSQDRRSGSMSLRLDLPDLFIRIPEVHEVHVLAGIHQEDARLGLVISLPVRMRPADFKARLLEAPARESIFFFELPPQPESSDG